MQRSRRKPVVKSLAVAADAVAWRLRIHLEMLEGITLPPQFKEPMRRMYDALDDYEASKLVGGGANGHAPQQVEESKQLRMLP